MYVIFLKFNWIKMMRLSGKFNLATKLFDIFIQAKVKTTAMHYVQ